MKYNKIFQTLGLALVLGLGGIGAAQAHDDDGGAAFAGAMVGATLGAGLYAPGPVVYAPEPVVVEPRYYQPIVYDGDWHDRDWREHRWHEHHEHEDRGWHGHHGHDDD